jgi:flagellar protein FliO/FliZ
MATIVAIATAPASAADGAVPSAVSAGGLQAVVGFATVLALMAALAWLVRRLGLTRVTGTSPVKVVGGVSVGGRERVLIVEAGDQWIVLGVAPGRVNALATMPRQETPSHARGILQERGFLARLQQSVESRNGG